MGSGKYVKGAKHPRLVRLDAHRLKVVNDFGVEVVLFASEDVPVEAGAVDELLSVTELAGTAERVGKVEGFLGEGGGEVVRMAVTPDFHKGAGIPIGTVLATRGFVVPQAIGNDINCGMRLHVTSLRADQVIGKLDVIEAAARHLYFEGGRSIPMTRLQRTALLREGLGGLMGAVPRSQSEGLWGAFHERVGARDAEKVHGQGGEDAGGVWGLDDFLGPKEGMSRDGQIGSIGGGNHFVEIQRVTKILDGGTAYAWGLKQDQVVIMIHSGSLSIGHHTGSFVKDLLRNVWPAGVKHPENGIFMLPDSERHQAAMETFWMAMSNAANFAFANRLFLGLMAMEALTKACGSFSAPLLYDAPHNLVWREGDVFLHRKGACPARGYEAMAGTAFEFYGEPVLVPGSMGSSSFILAGMGNAESLQSVSHGAGRAMSRGDALRGSEAEFRSFLERFRVVTAVDFRRPDIAMRRDIVEKKMEDIKKEAPFAYKGIGPVIETIRGGGLARVVAEVEPLMTVKA